MPRKLTEDAIQRALIHWIGENYPGVVVLAIRNEDMRERSDEIVRGHPDLHMEYNRKRTTHILKLELKTKKGRLSAAQREWNIWFDNTHKSKNCKRAVAYGFTEAKQIVSTWINSLKESHK